MDKPIKTGGPAFPKTAYSDPDGRASYDSQDQDGMSLRDYFAAHALGALHGGIAELLVNSIHPEPGESDKEVAYRAKKLKQIGASAYLIADSMLAARNGSEVANVG